MEKDSLLNSEIEKINSIGEYISQDRGVEEEEIFLNMVDDAMDCLGKYGVNIDIEELERNGLDKSVSEEIYRQISLRKEKEEMLATLRDDMIEQSKDMKVFVKDRDSHGRLLVKPNGAVSQLPYRQWKIVRTEAFKKWFGDWQDLPIKSIRSEENTWYSVDDEGKYLVTQAGRKEKKGNVFDLVVFTNLDIEKLRKFSKVCSDENSLKELKIFQVGEDNLNNVVEDVKDINNSDRIFVGIFKEGRLLDAKRAYLTPTKGKSMFKCSQGEKTLIGGSVINIKYGLEGVSKIVNDNYEPRFVGKECFFNVKNPCQMNSQEFGMWVERIGFKDDTKGIRKLRNHILALGYDALEIDGKIAFDKKTGQYICKKECVLKF